MVAVACAALSSAVAWGDPPSALPRLAAEPAQPMLARPAVGSPALVVAPPAPPDTSYRAPIVIMDVVSVVAAVNRQTPSVSSAGITTYVLTSPILHVVHHHARRALASLALRVALPLAGNLLAHELTDPKGPCPGDPCDTEGQAPFVIIGTVFGVLTASTIDIAYLARGDDDVPAQPAGIHF
nr:hypothetical protein [Kofleriaceae bacterium]